MFVGSATLDKEYLKKIYHSPELVRKYSQSLVPKEFSHLKEIQDNQLYLICMTLRKIGITDYKRLKATISELLPGLRITGYVDTVIDISVVYNIVNRDKVNFYLERLG